MSRTITQAVTVTRDRMAALSELTADLGGWKPALDVIRRIEAVPTIFPKYDQIVGIGGNPVGRIMLVHGPSNEGKSGFCLGLGCSYLARNHIFALADAERTASVEWLQAFASEYIRSPGFIALPVNTYEQVRAEVRRLCDTVAEKRASGKLPIDTTGLIVVDSIRKLVPEEMWRKLTKELADGGAKKGGRRGAKVGLDGFGGRGAQIKAAMNAMWVDELIPLLANTRMTIAIIAREHEEELNDFFGNTRIKVGGGDALNYDASLRVRVLRDYVYTGEGPGKQLVGEKHILEIMKTKLGTKVEAIPRAYFHTSNGALSPVGFDLARDLLELGVEVGSIERRGSYYCFGTHSLGQGETAALKTMHQDAELLFEIEAETRARFKIEVTDAEAE